MHRAQFIGHDTTKSTKYRPVGCLSRMLSKPSKEEKLPLCLKVLMMSPFTPPSPAFSHGSQSYPCLIFSNYIHLFKVCQEANVNVFFLQRGLMQVLYKVFKFLGWYCGRLEHWGHILCFWDRSHLSAVAFQ